MEHNEVFVADDSAVVSASPGELHIDSSFERFLFSLLPTLILILLSPFYLRHYHRQPLRIRSGPVLRSKLVCLFPLCYLTFLSLVSSCFRGL
jgi:hypothetical protein